MIRRGLLILCAACAIGLFGCAHVGGLPEYAEVERQVHAVAHHQPGPVPNDAPMATVVGTEEAPAELLGPRPVDVFVRRALDENRLVQAARYNVLALRARIPQVTSLDNPVVSNTIYPIPSVAPQYSLMGYNPYNLLLAQQFPWFGTLRLRGLAAEQDAQVALAELCAAQLEAVASVKRAYFDLHFNERAEQILLDNRRLAEDFLRITRARYETTNAGLQNVLQAEVVIRDLDRELVRVRQGVSAARAELAQQLHISPEADLRTLVKVAVADAPAQVDRLYQLAVVARPELQGRLAAIARDARAVELARKRFYPNWSLGFSFMDMTRQNAMSPTAGGMPNVGMFIGFDLPVYRAKLHAGVAEAQARAVADAKLYEAERDSTNREIKDLFTQVQAQRSILGYFQTGILPKAKEALDTATSGYETGQLVDFPTLITSWREVLQIELQIAQVESELGKALASLERAVGTQINQSPPANPNIPAETPKPPPPPTSPTPFRSPPETSEPKPRVRTPSNLPDQE